jgi:HAMP domain-containing protein
VTAAEIAERMRQLVDLLDALVAGHPTERTLTDAAAELDDLADALTELARQ